MQLKENRNQICELVYRVARRECATVTGQYCCEGTTEYPEAFSMYFIIEYGLAKKKIRISNHLKQHKNVVSQKSLSSLTVHKGVDYARVEQFVCNKIKEIKRGALYAAFDYLKRSA